MQNSRSARGRGSRGFTLVEVSIVVVCVSIVAALAIVGFIRYRRTARMAEATNIMTSIKTEQEAYKGESGLYLMVSNDITSYYPSANPGKFTTQWGSDCTNCITPQSWKSLNVNPPAPVAYGYATIAGVGDDITSTGSKVFMRKMAVTDMMSSSGAAATPSCTDIAPTEPYYVVEAFGDTDGDGVACTVLALSCSNAMIMTNVGE